MASPIWEEGTPTTPYRELDEDDVPLSFYGPGASLSPSSMGSNGAAGGVRRSHTVTAAGSRLHRISSGSSQTGSTAVGSLERPLSASTGVSRRTSMKTASPSLNRVMEGSASEDDQAPQLQAEQYPSNAYLPAETDFDNQALYSSAAASLARHSSMPVSRAFGRDPSNPGAPWQRTGYQQHPMSPPAAPPSDASSADAAVEQRIRSKSIAAEVGLIASLTTSARITEADSVLTSMLFFLENSASSPCLLLLHTIPTFILSPSLLLDHSPPLYALPQLLSPGYLALCRINWHPRRLLHSTSLHLRMRHLLLSTLALWSLPDPIRRSSVAHPQVVNRNAMYLAILQRICPLHQVMEEA